MTKPSCLNDVYNMFTIVSTLGGYSTHHARAFFLFFFASNLNESAGLTFPFLSRFGGSSPPPKITGLCLPDLDSMPEAFIVYFDCSMTRHWLAHGNGIISPDWGGGHAIHSPAVPAP